MPSSSTLAIDALPFPRPSAEGGLVVKTPGLQAAEQLVRLTSDGLSMMCAPKLLPTVLGVLERLRPGVAEETRAQIAGQLALAKTALEGNETLRESLGESIRGRLAALIKTYKPAVN